MSRIDDLIAELCPDGVDFKQLGEIAELVRGNGMPKSVLTDEGVGAIHYGQIYTRYGAWATKTISFVSPETAVKLAKVDPGDIIITNTSENVEDVGKAVAWLGEKQIVTGGHATVIKHGQDAKYLSYWFQTSSFYSQKKSLATGTKVVDVSAKQLQRVRVPVPPLEIQHEIVRVLDKFAQLELELRVELEAELKARMRQYEYYRDKLLTFDETAGGGWTSLSEIGQFVRGRRFTKQDMVPCGIPCIHYGEIYTHYGVSASQVVSHVREDISGQLRYAQPGDVVIAAVGETVEDVGKAVAWLGEVPVAIHDDSFCFRSGQNPTYVSYVMRTTSFREQKNRHVSRAKVKRIGSEGLGKIRIPLPPLEEQRRIVSILDRFDALVNHLSSGLPAEIAARRKQYEYYRDRLLTFEEKR
ncbi:restriction endonuclease subunit S [Arachnia propionica]|uniref:Restriction endonuclease subunit S n=1 Tax=Arachnia propionica TaxID=1750 RepID=A0A3P1WRT1_9ACTN|nr:restriction endonuclease subunit S [Arachnia propionica]RRD49329.1 restriction endonuclease subunit S [Arachnia propionica]